MAGLYIHIPFCASKCGYCDFLSFAGKTEQEMLRYITLLKKQADMKNGSRCFHSVYIGGGTPTLLPLGCVEGLLETLRQCMRIASSAEITIECNPGTLTEEKAREYARAGVNRISIGLQSGEDELLKTLGRIHTYEQFAASFEIAAKHFANINTDIIYGIPGQTVHQQQSTMQRLMELGPQHVSAYSLILEEGTPFYEKYSLTEEDLIAEQELCSRQVLADSGYERYEISNYARPGFECRHNINYWRLGEYGALGLGAVSMLREDGNLVRRRNTADLAVFEDDPEAYEAVEYIDKPEEMFETIMMGLRMTQGIELNDFAQRFGAGFEQLFSRQVRKLTADGLLRIAQGRVSLTERGLDIQNTVLLSFMQGGGEQ